MSKQVTAAELAVIVSTLLTNPESLGELDGTESFSSFMTDIAKVVCDHCGGEVQNPAGPFGDVWFVGVHGNDAVPDAHGGVWRGVDPDGELWEEGTARWFQQEYGDQHPKFPQSDWQSEVANGDTKLLYWEWVVHKDHADSLSKCTDCGAKVDAILGCPDGSEVCSDCAVNH